VRKALLLEGLMVAIAALGLGAAAWWLTGLIWLALPVCACSAVLPVCFLRCRDISQRPQADRLEAGLAAERGEHEATRQFIQRLLDVVPMPIYVKDANSRVIVVNQAQAEQWGRVREEIIGTRSFDLAVDVERTKLSFAEDVRVLGGEVIYKEEHVLRGFQGREQFRIITKGRCEDTQGKHVIVCARFDTTGWRQAERELQQTLEREVLLRERYQEFIQRVIDVIPDPFYIKDRNSKILMLNAAFADERGRSRESMLGKHSSTVAVRPEFSLDTAREDDAVVRGETIDKEQHYVMDNGDERFRIISKRPCTDADGMPVIVVAHINITRWKLAERKLARLAHEDELTGLPNRRRFISEAERLISLATRHGNPLSLIIFDLDLFKQINDEHGHVTGDQVLQKVAARLMAQMRSEDLPCRWGGEEFVVLLTMTDMPMAIPVAERLREAFAGAPIEVDQLSLALTISGGVVQKLAHESLNECIARADKALYAAKHAGRNRFLSA